MQRSATNTQHGDQEKEHPHESDGDGGRNQASIIYKVRPSIMIIIPRYQGKGYLCLKL